MIKHLVEQSMRVRSSSLQGRTALITGASSGIGLATAVRLVLEGCHLHLVARRKERLTEHKLELLNLNPIVNVIIHCLDVCSADAISQLEQSGALESDIFLNNAGLAKGLSSVVDAEAADWSEMLNTNVNAAFKLSKAVVQRMTTTGRGDIIALSSLAAHTAYENGAVYCASKHALRAFHESLRLETIQHGIRVIMISPGMVNTEFSLVRFNGDVQRAEAVYEGVNELDAGDVAESILFALKQPNHININDILIMPQQQGNPWRVHRHASR